MRAWMVTAIAAFGIHAAPCQTFEVFKSAEIDSRLEKLRQPAIIYQGANFTISLNAQFAAARAFENDSRVDEIISIRSGTGALVLGDRPYEVAAGDLISVPRGTPHRLNASSPWIEYVDVRLFGKGIPSPGYFDGSPRVLTASEIAAAIANGSTQTILGAPTFLLAYAIYSGHWGDWEEHNNHGHIYFLKSGRATAGLGGQLQNAKQLRRNTLVGTGATSAQRYEVGRGDIVVIPPNTSHHMDLIDERLGYVFVWVRDD